MTQKAKAIAAEKDSRERRSGRRPGQKDYTADQRAVALSVLDFCDGNLTHASRETGIRVNTLASWRDKERKAQPARAFLYATTLKCLTLSIIR